jgi:hypothetical protein
VFGGFTKSHIMPKLPHRIEVTFFYYPSKAGISAQVCATHARNGGSQIAFGQPAEVTAGQAGGRELPSLAVNMMTPIGRSRQRKLRSVDVTD